MQISNEKFAAVIRSASQDVDWREFGIAIAENDPDLFVKTVDDLVDKEWKASAKKMAESGLYNRVSLIKDIRERTGKSLTEAREWVDNNLTVSSEGES